MPLRNPQAVMLADVMRKIEDLLAGVKPDQMDFPTPDSDWNVRRLENHIVGTSLDFAAREAGQAGNGDPGAYQVGEHPAREFHPSTEQLTTALDEKLSDPAQPEDEGGGFPPSATATVMIAEYVLHGWDLATATRQPVPFTDAEARAALGIRAFLTPEYRDQMFDPELPAPPNATALQQLLAYSGREPG